MQWLFKPISIYPLVYFRIVFGLLMFLEGIGAVVLGWVQEHYVEPGWHFNYIGLGWLYPLPGQGMVYVYLLMSAVGLLLLLGWHYRLFSVLFFLLFGYCFFSEKTHYLNHHYLIFLVSGLMVFLPVHRKFSLDVRRKPKLERDVVPNWALWLLRLQLVIVYFYAGIAKIQADWLSGRPVRIWMSRKADYPLIGQWLAREEMVWFISWGGIMFDLSIAWLLLYKPTRRVGFVAAVLFHVFNSVVFKVGVFPWFMIFATVLFFEPEEIARWFFRVRVEAQRLLSVKLLVPDWQRNLTALLLGLYLAFQVLFPLRHLLIPGDVNWTEEGHRFSWRMMLRSKSGRVYFIVVDPATGSRFHVRPSTYLTRDQTFEMADHPDMIWQFAQFLKEEYQQKGIPDPQVYAQSMVSLNGHPNSPLVNPETDLAAIPYTWGAKPWVMPRPAPGSWPWQAAKQE